MRRRMALIAVLALAVLVPLGAGQAGGASKRGYGTGPPPSTGKAPRLNHIFIIVLENEDATTSFGPKSEAPYLAKTLRRKGEFLPNYYGTAHNSLANYVAMISGQAPNVQTQADCPIFAPFTPGTPTSDGQFVGSGCVYPPGVETVANQLEDSGYTWRGYMQDMAKGTPKTCRHPSIGSPDNTQTAHKGDQYAGRHNPFIYFHSIIDFPTCAKNDVDLKYLQKDLKRGRTTPSYSFITPNLCYDGHDAPCVDGKPGGLKSANVYLKKWVPRITHSPAFRKRGLLIVTFDEAEASSDSTACCNEPPGPNLVPPDTPGATNPGPGGGRVGAVLLSPCLKAGTVTKTPFNHYSMLRSVEDNFGLPHLGYAGQKGLVPFGRAVLNKPSCRGPGY